MPAMAQIRVGVKVMPGFGFIKSRQLKKTFNNLGKDYPGPGTLDYKVSSPLRIHFAFGGFIEYKINEKFFVQVEPLFTLSSNKIFINSSINNLDQQQSGTFTRVRSDAKIRSSYFALPLIGKFRFNHRKDLFALGGLSLNFHFTPKLISHEERVTVSYDAGVSTQYPKEDYDNTLKVKSYRVFNMNALVGVGKVFNPRGHNVIIDIRYSLPLTKSSLFVEGDIPNTLINNSIFTQNGKAISSYSLKDFRMGVLSASIAYTIYKNYK